MLRNVAALRNDPNIAHGPKFNCIDRVGVTSVDVASTAFFSFLHLRPLINPLSLPPSPATIMALPAVKTAYECADFGRTVAPYFSQLNDLPSKLVASGGDLESLKDIYLSTNPLITSVAFTLSIVPIFVLLSEINKNYSQVDRAWSVLPVIYNAHYTAWAHLAGLDTERLDTISIFSVIWGVSIVQSGAPIC
jgi:hypothetical protein